MLHLVEDAQGTFVGEVRAAYRAVLDRIGASCGEHGSFHGPYIEELLQYVQTAYGDELEYPWKDMDAAVIRSHLSQKWYALFMKVHTSKIGISGSQPIRIMNLHGTAEQVAALVDGERYFPGWHMNRKFHGVFVWHVLWIGTMVEIIPPGFVMMKIASMMMDPGHGQAVVFLFADFYGRNLAVVVFYAFYKFHG